ncbi:redox-regulated ATPase YchF [Candidatus Dojkabacteria bacterium]|nr:redox-regulated ATPase YchF [Candidatus Dojkabacteria bacterium]
MDLKVGIVGLPNVGKSTLFNILTHAQVAAENYPFCTIDPNVGIVKVKDERLDKLAQMENSKRIVPAVIEFFDIAGLVKGAHRGEGLGNQFLANIREVNIILHVVRDFENPNIKHVNDKIEPVADIETVELELILKDIETVKAVALKQERLARTNENEADWLGILQDLLKHLESEKKAYEFEFPQKDFVKTKRKELSLLTDKDVIYLINSDKADFSPELQTFLQGRNHFRVNLRDIQDLEGLSDKEKVEYVEELGIDQINLEALIRMCYEVLGLISFFTAGEKESRAWTIKAGMNAAQAAGVIHTDFQKNFIAAEVVHYEDFVELGGFQGAKEKGKFRLEGADYTIQDGDVLIIKHNA